MTIWALKSLYYIRHVQLKAIGGRQCIWWHSCASVWVSSYYAKHHSTALDDKPSGNPSHQGRGTMKDPCFWISNHLPHIPYSYCHTLQKLHTDIKNKHRDKLNDGLILLHDNAPPAHRLHDEVNAMLLQDVLQYLTFIPDLTHTIFTSLDQ